LAVRFFLMSAVLLVIAVGGAWLVPRSPWLVGATSESPLLPVFVGSTLCLIVGSAAMIRAEYEVSRERQRPFRRSLLWALLAGTAFVAIQCYALVNFLDVPRSTPAAQGMAAFVTVVAGLHGLHFLVAWLFLVFIVLQAFADRYDHEYHAGVTFCGWFWHGLGIVWLAVMCLLLIVNQTFVQDGAVPDVNWG